MKHYKWVYDGKGEVEKVECKDHFYAWSGNMPCTGALRCIYCGRVK